MVSESSPRQGQFYPRPPVGCVGLGLRAQHIRTLPAAVTEEVAVALVCTGRQLCPGNGHPHVSACVPKQANLQGRCRLQRTPSSRHRAGPACGVPMQGLLPHGGAGTCSQPHTRGARLRSRPLPTARPRDEPEASHAPPTAAPRPKARNASCWQPSPSLTAGGGARSGWQTRIPASASRQQHERAQRAPLEGGHETPCRTRPTGASQGPHGHRKP